MTGKPSAGLVAPTQPTALKLRYALHSRTGIGEEPVDQLSRWLLPLSFGLIIFISTSARGAETPKQPPPPEAPVAAMPASNKTTAPAAQAGPYQNELTVLKAQNALIKEHQSDLLSTVHWSLGVTVTLLVLFAGLGWITNFKIFDSQQQKLRADVDEKIDSFNEVLKAALTSHKSDLLVELAKKTDDAGAEIRQEINLAIGKASAPVEKLQARFDEMKDVLDQHAKDAALDAKELIRMNAEVRLIEETVWELKGVWSNVILTQSQALEAATELEDEGYVKLVLRRIKDVLADTVIPEKKVISPYSLESLEKNIAVAERTAAVAVNEIRELIAQVAVEKVEGEE